MDADDGAGVAGASAGVEVEAEVAGRAAYSRVADRAVGASGRRVADGAERASSSVAALVAVDADDGAGRAGEAGRRSRVVEADRAGVAEHARVTDGAGLADC